MPHLRTTVTVLGLTACTSNTSKPDPAVCARNQPPPMAIDDSVDQADPTVRSRLRQARLALDVYWQHGPRPTCVEEIQVLDTIDDYEESVGGHFSSETRLMRVEQARIGPAFIHELLHGWDHATYEGDGIHYDGRHYFSASMALGSDLRTKLPWFQDRVPAHIGDDYELLVTAPQPLPGFHVIGAVAPGPAALRWSDGTAAEPAGWEHA